MINNVFTYCKYDFYKLDKAKIFYSGYIFFYVKLIIKLKQHNEVKPLVVINICPSKLLAKIEGYFCKKMNIQFCHYPFKLKNSTVQENYVEIKKLVKIIDKHTNNNDVWLHCFHGCHRTGLVMSKIIKRNIYNQLCVNAKQPIHSEDIQLLEKLKIK
jgi:protein tyrosine/serine phosphatase